MKRSDFFSLINNSKTDLSFLELSLDFSSKPTNEEIKNKIKKEFKIELTQSQLSLFNCAPDWLFMEENEEFKGWKYIAHLDLNELYDDIIKNNTQIKEEFIKVYRIETLKGKGVYDSGIGFKLLNPGISPSEDGEIALIFNNNVKKEYQKKWVFGFKNKEQLSIWIDIKSKKNKENMKNNELVLIEIEIGKYKVVEGKEQIIFKKEDIVRKKVLNIDDFCKIQRRKI